MAKEHLKVIAGIDTHTDARHVAIISETGRHVVDQEFLAVESGYRKIIDAGVEGTGSYGAELARILTKEGIQILEVMRPNRQGCRLHGKSDPLDAYQAAESVLAGRSTATPKARDGAVESLRVLRAERATAMRARVAVMNQVQGILVSAPEPLRAKYRGLGSAAIIAALEKTRPAGNMALHQEIALIDAELDRIITTHAPLLRDLYGVGTDVASLLLVTVGDSPQRIAPKHNSPPSSGSHRSPHPPARPHDTGSAAAVIGRRTKRSTVSCSCG